jgi:hypothetical protein
MLALSGLREGFARGVVYLHTACPERSRRAYLPVPKNPAAKPCIFISSKLIEINGLQLHYFGHLRKTGGRGSYRLVHTPHLPVPKSLAAKSNYSGHPAKDVHPEPAEGLFSPSELSTNGCRPSASSSTPFLSPVSNSRASSFQVLAHSFISAIIYLTQ